jgi:hypothetical protein
MVIMETSLTIGTVVNLIIGIVSFATLFGILGFAVYAEFFDGARFSRNWDYLTPEEMDLILTEEKLSETT